MEQTSSTQQLRNDMQKAGQHAKEAASEQGEQIKDKARKVIDKASEKVSNVAEKTGEYFDEIRGSVQNYIEKKPFTSAAIVALAGFVIGMMCSKK